MVRPPGRRSGLPCSLRGARAQPEFRTYPAVQPVPTQPAGLSSNAGLSSVIGDFEQYVGVTRLVERAVAREVGAAELLLDVLNRDHQPTREQIVAVPTNGLCASEFQRMRVAPLGRARHDYDGRRKARSLST